MPDRKEINKRGYLKEDFRLFHLKDSRAQKVDYHYHAFDKLILLLGGKVTYVVEGVTYFLQPWDLLLVGHDLIHRPIIDPAEPYERVVIWLGREWLERRSDPGEALDTCFDTTRERGFHLLRFDAERRLHYMQRIQQLEEALRDRSFGAARMADTLCQQMLIDVNRDVLRSRTAQEERDSYRVDPKMEEVLRYILDHLGEELTVESLSKRFFISRYYLMHRFKAVTGYTLDKDGNVVDGSGKLVLAAQQLKALPSKAAESKPEADTKTDVKTDAKPADGSDPDSGSSSIGSSNSSSGSSGNSSGGSSDSSSDSGNSGSSTPVAPDPTPVHQHSWEPVYKTVEDYEMREISYCVTCGQDMTGWSNAQLIEHSDYHLDRGESDQWRSEGRQVKVGEHQEIDYYICSCGATKAP